MTITGSLLNLNPVEFINDLKMVLRSKYDSWGHLSFLRSHTRNDKFLKCRPFLILRYNLFTTKHFKWVQIVSYIFTHLITHFVLKFPSLLTHRSRLKCLFHLELGRGAETVLPDRRKGRRGSVRSWFGPSSSPSRRIGGLRISTPRFTLERGPDRKSHDKQTVPLSKRTMLSVFCLLFSSFLTVPGRTFTSIL